MSVTVGTVNTFANVKPDKAQALKVLEEASEVHSAWEDYRAADKGPHTMKVDVLASDMQAAVDNMLDEIADTITACCNLAAALGCEDMTERMAACEDRNRKRGRYDG